MLSSLKWPTVGKRSPFLVENVVAFLLVGFQIRSRSLQLVGDLVTSVVQYWFDIHLNPLQHLLS